MTKRKKNQQKSTGKRSEETKTSTPPEQSGTAIEAQSKPDRDDREASNRFPVVGIGASAGGLAAFEAFFSGMPADTDPGMAFVLVQHLAPDHKSILTDLIRRYTRMQVFEVEDGIAVQPNCAYIIPPNRDMAFLNGTLQLLEPTSPRGQRMPIDFFFRSLAQDQRERAIGVVLSGTGSDGTLGVRSIKGEGGMVMAQNPESTEYDGMPRSAIATGLVDYELPPAEMAAQLIAYTTHAFGKPPRSAPPAPKTENTLKKIFVLLRARTGHDFSQYKPSTIGRRIERRMAVHQIESMDDYVKFIRQTSAEVDALFIDMLIGVTSFFRDPEAFKSLEEQVIPKLFAGKLVDVAIRIWVPGCSTGEEAYSLAILLFEHQETMKQRFNVQVFATDIDSHAIDTARAGIYPASIAADVTPERLARFFSSEPGNSDFRINKNIRDMLVFSEQNVIRDPPFSKLDLISCRNLLIYLGGDLQKKLIPLFHYALNPGGFLFLGTSETVGEYQDIFTVLDRKLKVYQRKEDFSDVQRSRLGRFLPPMTVPDTVSPCSGEKTASPGKPPLRELTEQALLQQLVQVGALVDAQGDILYLHGRTGMYLEPTPGESEPNNILKMAREGLCRDLTTALHKAVRSSETVRCPGLRVKTNGDLSTVNLIIRPVTAAPSASSEPPLYLVILEQAPEPVIRDSFSAAGGQDGQTASEEPAGEDVDARVTALKQELQAKEEYLQTTNEELETSNEELKSSNEEMQSVNEELQSTNEELETSKEELQSVNEELATVNAELQTKVTDLSRANNDMNNLLAGTGIATLFVDIHLRILRFTPAVMQIINLIQSDIGRPVGHIVSNLPDYDTLSADTRAVLDSLIPKELDVRSADGRWYTMRILPYRTIDNVIEGVVLTFVDITERKRAEEELRQTKAVLQTAMDCSSAGIAIADAPNGQLLYVNDAGLLICGGDRESSVKGVGVEQYVESWKILDFDGMPLKNEEVPLARAIMFGETNSRDFIIRNKENEDRFVTANAAPVKDENGKTTAAIVVFTDITERKQAEENLRKERAILKTIIDNIPVMITRYDPNVNLLYLNKEFEKKVGWKNEELKDINLMEEVYPAPDYRKIVQEYMERAVIEWQEFSVRAKSGENVISEWSNIRLDDDTLIGIGIDVTERKQAEEALQESEQKYRTLHELSPDAHIVGEVAADSRDLGFVDCNQAMLDLLGMTREQLLAADADSLSPERQPDGRLSREKAGEQIARCLSKGSLRFDWVHLRAGGEPFPVEITMTVYHEQGKTFLHAVWRDLTGLTRTAPPTEQPVPSKQKGEKP